MCICSLLASVTSSSVCGSGELVGSVMLAGEDKEADSETEGFALLVVLVGVCCAGAGELNNVTGGSRMGDNGGGFAADALYDKMKHPVRETNNIL